MALSEEEIYQRIKEVLVEQLGVEESEITKESAFQADLDADSLDLVELIMELEDQFGIKISDEDAQKMVTVQDVINYLMKQGSDLPPAARDDDAPAPVPVAGGRGPSGDADGTTAEEAVTESTP